MKAHVEENDQAIVVGDDALDGLLQMEHRRVGDSIKASVDKMIYGQELDLNSVIRVLIVIVGTASSTGRCFHVLKLVCVGGL